MIRNFVAGGLWGAVVAAVGLGVISQVTPMPGAKRAEPAVSAAVQSEPAPGDPVAQPADAGAEAVAEILLPKPDQTAAVVPDPVQPDAAIAEASPPAQAPDAGPKPQVPPLALTAAPDVAEVLAAGEVAGADAAPLANAPGGLPDASAAETTPASAELPPPPRPKPSEEPLLDAAPPPVEDPAPALIVPEQDVPLPQVPETPTPVLPETETPVLPAVVEPVVPAADVETEAVTGPATLAPTAPLNSEIAGVTTGRLPRIGDVAIAAPADGAAPVDADMPPIQRFARPFQNDSGNPLFAVVLRDTGAADVDRAKLAALPFPISFVIDPLAENAAEAATIYRAAGQEVVMLASGIPAGAQASDLEQTFQAHSGTLPDAVAVMDLEAGGFQDDRPLATLVVPLIQSQGRGLITFDRGLNAADQVARREDVPSATIFRQLDAEGEDAPLIRRYLDRAAFKAAQEGRVMVLGETRPETIVALMEWTVEGRASSVTLAPVTAVMAAR